MTTSPASLSELITLCGDDLHLEINVELPSADGLKRMCRAQKVVQGPSRLTTMYWGYGQTVDEAVANLYSDIHKS